MSKKILFLVAISSFAAWSVHASEGCDPGLIRQYHGVLSLVDSLRPDKSGQMRVYAVDGSEFTAGQVRWMQGQLQLVDDACARGDQPAAISLLSDVRQLIKTHQRAS